MHPCKRTSKRAALAGAILFGLCGVASAQYVGNPQPYPGVTPGYPAGTQTTVGDTTTVVTANSLFPEQNPFIGTPSNLLPTIYNNVTDVDGTPIPNTLPSTPTNPYNLTSNVVVTPLKNALSPADDLASILRSFHVNANKLDIYFNRRGDTAPAGDPIRVNQAAVQRAIDIILGKPVANRYYSGYPLLHYIDATKVKTVQPVLDSSGNVIGGNVVINQIWYRDHIESDTAMLNVSQVMGVPWTVTYHIYVLNRGADDFSPMIMYLSHNPTTGSPFPGVMMDGSFLPMAEGTEVTLVQHEAPGKFFNLIYTWGWRVHPGRIQVTENAAKVVAGYNLLQWEQASFCPLIPQTTTSGGTTTTTMVPNPNCDPSATKAGRNYAIAQISNLAPAKRMLHAFEMLKHHVGSPRHWVHEAEAAYSDWSNRNRLPRGVKPDPNADVTLFYCNNTIYGSVKGFQPPHNNQVSLPQWTTRGTSIKIKVINGDYYQRGYMAVDFGGLRGWENTFFSSIPIGGDGPWFTFGRDWWYIVVTPTMIGPAVPAEAPSTGTPSIAEMSGPRARLVAFDKHFYSRRFFDSDASHDADDVAAQTGYMIAPNGDKLAYHWFDITLNYEPNPRLRLYQFDPLHHDEAIYSIH
ncbi:MAG: hypothetical protein ACP5NP_02190 [Acetobacteraceae bacterium]